MGEQLHILIVDDNPDMADSLADILQVKGYDVHTTHSGAQALNILHDHPIDILLTDVKMPGMNGLELYRETRKAYPKLVTIFMTAYTADELIRQGMAEGVKIILDKPVDIGFLLALFSAEKRIINEIS